MGINPRIVAQDVRFLWDGVSQRLPKGQVIDVAPGGALEDAIGAENLVPFATPARSAPGQPTAEATPEPEPLLTGGLITEVEAARVGESGPEGVAPRQEKSPAEPAAPAKKQDGDDEKDGDS